MDALSHRLNWRNAMTISQLNPRLGHLSPGDYAAPRDAGATPKHRCAFDLACDVLL